MGARQSKRSVDISTTPKKDKSEGGVEEKLEKIEEPELAKVQNGTAAAHTEESAQKEGGGGDASEAVSAEEKSDQPSTVENETTTATAETEEKKDAKEVTTPESPQEEKQPGEEKQEKKKKDKKKKWSFRSISFTRKDKSKPNMSREDSKTGDLSKEAPVPEAGEVAATEEKVQPAEDAAKEQTLPENDQTKTKTEETVKTEVEDTKKEETVKVEETKEEKTVEQKVVESSHTTTITESSTVLVSSSSQFVQEIMEVKCEESSIAPPLPASPPPTEAPPPTPIVPTQPQPEQEEVNGGGESMAEMPEENGLGSDEKIDDEEEELPKINGHHEDSPVKQVDSLIEDLNAVKISKPENNGDMTAIETTVQE